MIHYDSRPDTLNHITRVQALLDLVMVEIRLRAFDHDQTKLRSPEVEVFDRVTPLLKLSEYGSKEYLANLADMKVALKHHYAAYRHHPEHHENGIHDMNLIDLIEMLADWKAATERMENGDLRASIKINAERFGYEDEIKILLLNTAKDMGWI